MRLSVANLRRLQRRRRSRDGSAAVEFAMIALPFFMMLFAIFELATVITLDSVLENATIQTGRLVRTGQAESQGFDGVKFKQALCERMNVFRPDCANRARVDVRVVDNFANPIPPVEQPTGETDPYNGGEPGELMLVTVWYRQPVLTPFLSKGTSGSGRETVLTATTAFRNEPWGTPTPLAG